MYVERHADSELSEALERAGAVVIEGPKACGKTETALQVAASVVEVDTDPNVAQILATMPEFLLDGPGPRLFDEWHLQPELWNLVRRRVDREQERGLFILTGSAAPSADIVRHSGAGRFARVRMRTMTLMETGHSSGVVSLAAIAAGDDVRAQQPQLEFGDLLARMSTGGWPGFRGSSQRAHLLGVRDYLESLVAVDLHELSGKKHDPARIRRLIQSLARGVATEIKLSKLAVDADLARDTVRDYLDVLEQTFAIEDQPAWSSHLRSRVTLRKEPKRHLADPSLAVAALRAGPDDLARDLAYAGQLFESQVVHDLRVYSGETVFHARDSSGTEVDAVIEYPGGTLLLVEMKLGWSVDVTEQAAASLERFAQKIDSDRYPDIRKLIVVGGGYSYRRPDGTYVVPLASLAP